MTDTTPQEARVTRAVAIVAGSLAEVDSPLASEVFAEVLRPLIDQHAHPATSESVSEALDFPVDCERCDRECHVVEPDGAPCFYRAILRAATDPTRFVMVPREVLEADARREPTRNDNFARGVNQGIAHIASKYLRTYATPDPNPSEEASA